MRKGERRGRVSKVWKSPEGGFPRFGNRGEVGRKTRIPTVQIKGISVWRPWPSVLPPTAQFLDGQAISFLLFCETGERFSVMSVDEFNKKFFHDSSPAHPNQGLRSRLYDENSTLNSGARTRPTSRGGKKPTTGVMIIS